jgi:carotenoid cleavage dioxygenase-like enzyme
VDQERRPGEPDRHGAPEGRSAHRRAGVIRVRREGRDHPDIAYYEADRSGRIIHEAWFEAPYSSMIHDWAVTAHFVMFPVIPLTSAVNDRT